MARVLSWYSGGSTWLIFIGVLVGEGDGVLLYSKGSTWCLLAGLLAAAVAHTLWRLWVQHLTPACRSHISGPEWWCCLMPTHRARVGSVLLPESMQRERSAYGGLTLLFVGHQKWSLASLAGPRLLPSIPQLPHSSLFNLSPYNQPRSCPWV